MGLRIKKLHNSQTISPLFVKIGFSQNSKEITKILKFLKIIEVVGAFPK